MTAPELRELEQLKEQFTEIERFKQSVGWQLFDQAFVQMENTSFQLMVASPNAHEMAKHLGAFHAIRNARTWPQRAMDALLVQINMANEAAIPKVRSIR